MMIHERDMACSPVGDIVEVHATGAVLIDPAIGAAGDIAAAAPTATTSGRPQAYAAEIGHFVTPVQGGGRRSPDFEDGLQALRLAEQRGAPPEDVPCPAAGGRRGSVPDGAGAAWMPDD